MKRKIYDIFRNAPKRDWSADYNKFADRGKTRASVAKKKLEESHKPNTKPSLAIEDYTGTYSEKCLAMQRFQTKIVN